MQHKIIRIILGLLLLIVGIVVLIRGNLEWWNGAMWLLIGVAFLFSGIRMNKKK